MIDWEPILKERYRVLSEMGIDTIKRFVEIFEKKNMTEKEDGTNYGYEDAVREAHGK